MKVPRGAITAQSHPRDLPRDADGDAEVLPPSRRQRRVLGGEGTWNQACSWTCVCESPMLSRTGLDGGSVSQKGWPGCWDCQ